MSFGVERKILGGEGVVVRRDHPLSVDFPSGHRHQLTPKLLGVELHHPTLPPLVLADDPLTRSQVTAR
ncbi:MAG TPA: hypothetical protein VMK12_12500 [Anaeromyxobacteraceae bacterium]|nr:hypothetical protein [Anaeromyxobacteraceae bacterium]